MSLRRRLLPLLLLAACTRAADEPAVLPADTAVAVPAPESAATPAEPAAPTDPVVERFRARLPASAFVRAGACPFECCVYGEWKARTPIPVRSRERTQDPPAFTIAAGDRFRADSGNVYIDGVMVVAVEDSVGDPPYWSFARGDTLVILDYVGEGRYNVWHEGKVQEAEGFWGAGAPVGNATTYGRWSSEWWVHAVLPDGRSGWFLADTSVKFAGADACGGPIE